MRWPRWFPYPVNWLRSALALFFVVVVFFALIPTSYFGVLIADAVKHPAPLAISTLVGLLIPIFFLAIVHKSLFRRNVPGWFPRWSSWYEGTAIIVGSVLSFFVMMPFAAGSCGHYYRYCTDQEIGIILTIGLVFGAFFFQTEYLIRDAIGNRRKPKTAPGLAATPVDPVQQTPEQPAPGVEPPKKLQSNSILSELERLKKELGR